MEAPNRIRELRMAKGWSIQRLANAINMSKMNVSAIERGNVELNLIKMRQFARALGVSVADLLPLADNPLALTPDEIELIERRRQADANAREQFDKVAEVVLPYRLEKRANG